MCVWQWCKIDHTAAWMPAETPHIYFQQKQVGRDIIEEVLEAMLGPQDTLSQGDPQAGAFKGPGLDSTTTQSDSQGELLWLCRIAP